MNNTIFDIPSNDVSAECKIATKLGWPTWPPPYWAAKVKVAPLFGPQPVILPVKYYTRYDEEKTQVITILEMFFAGLTPQEIYDSVDFLRHPYDVIQIIRRHFGDIESRLNKADLLVESLSESRAALVKKYKKTQENMSIFRDKVVELAAGLVREKTESPLVKWAPGAQSSAQAAPMPAPHTMVDRAWLNMVALHTT